MPVTGTAAPLIQGHPSFSAQYTTLPETQLLSVLVSISSATTNQMLPLFLFLSYVFFCLCVCWRICECSVVPEKRRKANRMDETHEMC